MIFIACKKTTSMAYFSVMDKNWVSYIATFYSSKKAKFH